MHRQLQKRSRSILALQKEYRSAASCSRRGGCHRQDMVQNSRLWTGAASGNSPNCSSRVGIHDEMWQTALSQE
jgi:hypothetical protein